MLKKGILFVFLLATIILGQVVYTEPPFATRLDSFSVIFDATKGNGGLQGYSGTDVYAHTGVTIEGEGTWRYVHSTWGTADLPKFKLSKIDTDLWKLVIGNPYVYYEVPEGKIITQLSFVFRNTSGAVSGRDIGGADIYMDLEEPGALVTAFTNPFSNTFYGKAERTPYFMDPDSVLDITTFASANESPLLSHALYLNDTLLAQDTTDVLHYSFNPQNVGMHVFKVVAEDESGRKDSSYNAIMVLPDIVVENRPDGIEDGINYIDYTHVTLSFLAPYKENAFLIGDFNDWQVSEEYMMKSDVIGEDEVHWWIELSGLSPGQEYAFQYLVDGVIRIADPLTHKILHKDDAGIPESTYPGLKPYPNGKTDNAVAVFQTAQPEYDWQVDYFHAPAQHELIIYELHVRDFVAKHDYKTLKDTLDYLQNLGINAIELMPVSEFEDNESWGYNPSFWMAPDKYYGPADDLKAFIDACHQRGIAVILDIVLNHLYGQSPLVQLYVDYYASDEIIMQTPNPWFNRQSPNTQSYKWGADLNHVSPYTRYIIDRVTEYWLTEFKFDGFRFDFSKGFTNKSSDGWEYDPSRISNIKRMTDKIRDVNPNAYVILEHFTENTEERELADYGLMLWGHPNPIGEWGYYEATMGYHDGDKSDFSWGYYKDRGWDAANLVTKIESHDEERLMYKNLTYGNSSGSYNVKDLATALQRMKAASAFFFTFPGPKMFWQFMEVGYDFSIDYNGRVGNKPIRWDYYHDEKRRKLYDTIAALLKMREENAAFRDPLAIINMSVGKAMKRITIDHDSLKVSIIGNFGMTSSTIDPMFYETGTWYDFFPGDSIEVSDVNAPIALDPGEFHIFSNKKINSPQNDPVTSIQKISNVLPLDFRLDQNFPNPFNPQTVIGYQLPQSSKVLLKIYDAAGREVRTLINERQSAGKYQVSFDAKILSSGVYFYILQAGEYRFKKKMLLLK